MDDLKTQIQEYSLKIEDIYQEISKKVIWQKWFLQDLLIALFSKWHILIEWAPWLGKTLSVETLSEILSLEFQRIQFTPDLLPSDLIGNRIFNQLDNDFFIRKWPIFSNFVLADEINRAPSKVQSALLEAMAEKQVSIWDMTYRLDEPFIVLATQNPIEQEGTFSLPEAQLDRFLLKTIVPYPTQEEELEILKNISQIENEKISTLLSKQEILTIQNLVEHIYVDENIFTYIKDIVFFTREKNEKISQYLLYPVSPRASISLLKAAKTLAFLHGREFVIPEDIKHVAYGVLRHRILLNYEALADGIEADDIIKIILETIEVK